MLCPMIRLRMALDAISDILREDDAGEMLRVFFAVNLLRLIQVMPEVDAVNPPGDGGRPISVVVIVPP